MLADLIPDGRGAQVDAKLLDRSGLHTLPDPVHAFQILLHRVGNVDSRAVILHPANRKLQHGHPSLLGAHKQLRIEEPLVILHLRQQDMCSLGSNGLETALDIMKGDSQIWAEHEVVGARNEFTLGGASDLRLRHKTRAKGDCRPRPGAEEE